MPRREFVLPTKASVGFTAETHSYSREVLQASGDRQEINYDCH